MEKAIVLLNMGGANSLDEVEIFLKNMFADPNILTIKNRFIRKMVGWLIVSMRKNKSKEAYKLIGGKSPLPELTKRLVLKLQNELKDYLVVEAMRYTSPFDYEVINKCKSKGIKELILIPLYPQYSTTTTKSSFEGVEWACKKFDYFPTIKKIDRFYENSLYNEAVIERIREKLNSESASEFDLIFSAHGLPQKIIDRGDSYQKEIEENVNILINMLKKKGINFNNIYLAYQSKVGPMEWLKPSLEDKLKEITNKKVIIYPIAFIIDNSETNLELSIEYKEVAENLNFKDYRVCQCLNDSDTFVKALVQIVSKIEAK